MPRSYLPRRYYDRWLNLIDTYNLLSGESPLTCHICLSILSSLRLQCSKDLIDSVSGGSLESIFIYINKRNCTIRQNFFFALLCILYKFLISPVTGLIECIGNKGLVISRQAVPKSTFTHQWFKEFKCSVFIIYLLTS